MNDIAPVGRARNTRVSLEKSPWQVLRKGTWFRFAGSGSRGSSWPVPHGCHCFVADKTADTIRVMVLPESGHHVSFFELTRDELNKRCVEVTGWPRFGVRPIRKGDFPVRTWRAPRPSKKPFRPEPYGVGDWVQVVIDGQPCRAQMWAANWAVAETPDGNRFVQIERHPATRYRPGRFTTEGGSEVVRIPDPYVDAD